MKHAIIVAGLVAMLATPFSVQAQYITTMSTSPDTSNGITCAISYMGELNMHPFLIAARVECPLEFWDRRSGIWTPQSVGSDCFETAPAMVFDASNRPHVAAFAPARGLLHLYLDQGAWITEEIEDVPGVGAFPSIAVGSGHVYVSYYDSNNGDLKLATRSLGGVWTTELVDSAGNAGRLSSLVNTNGILAVSYDNLTDGHLKFAKKPGSVWMIETVDTVGILGGSSLVGRGTDYAISYYDFAKGDLKVAKRFEGAWSVQLVDSEGNVGRYSSLVGLGAGVADSLTVAYYDMTNGDLKLAQQFGTWSIHTIDSEGDVGKGATAGVTTSGPSDSFYVFYVDRTAATIKLYAQAIGGTTVGVNQMNRVDSRDWVRCQAMPGIGIRVRYGIAEEGPISLSIYDLHGRLVATPIRRLMAPGEYEHVWRGEGRDGVVAPGVYFFELGAKRARAIGRAAWIH